MTNDKGNLVISNVNVLEQHGDRVFMFSIAAEQLVTVGKVERFGTDPNGVNRKLDEDHATNIAQAMIDHSMIWLEAIQGDLGGGWLYDEAARTLTGPSDAYLSIDNGQHRRRALELLNPLEREHLAFTIVATMNMPFERRLKIFRMQRHQKRLDSRLDLAQRNVLGEWENPLDKEAYDLVLLLNSDTTSPLKGTILLEEQEKRPYEGRHRPVGINGKGLHVTIRSVIGPSSPLNALSMEQRKRTIVDLIQLAATIWPREWKSDKHVLTTARGINAVLGLVVSSPNFRGAIGDDFTRESLKKGLTLAQSFGWSATDLRNASVRDIVSRINQSIARNKRTKAAAA
ncbi:MAG TPA: hypothetical protein VHD31_02655 [Candidatus Paceibacterota bacterium]|nr:hypothetical protein [Candidatus Paceibacterota bacterium]